MGVEEDANHYSQSNIQISNQAFRFPYPRQLYNTSVACELARRRVEVDVAGGRLAETAGHFCAAHQYSKISVPQ